MEGHLQESSKLDKPRESPPHHVNIPISSLVSCEDVVVRDDDDLLRVPNLQHTGVVMSMRGVAAYMLVAIIVCGAAYVRTSRPRAAQG